MRHCSYGRPGVKHDSMKRSLRTPGRRPRRPAGAGPGGLQLPDQGRRGQRQHPDPGLAADHRVPAREGRPGRSALAPGPAQGRPRPQVLPQAVRPRAGEAARGSGHLHRRSGDAGIGDRHQAAAAGRGRPGREHPLLPRRGEERSRAGRGFRRAGRSSTSTTPSARPTGPTRAPRPWPICSSPPSRAS